MGRQKTAIIISVSSDIGMEMAKRYSRDGFTVVGTYRSKKLLPELRRLPNCHLFYCDLSDKKSINYFIKRYALMGIKWDVLVSCPCNPLPAQAFFKCDFDEWSDSVHVNVIEQLRLLHGMHPYRKKANNVDVVFFAGGGVNNAVVNFSAYTASKIMLIKMCEFLDAENKDLNVFIVGPGWTRTKTHHLVLANVDKNGSKYKEIIRFLNSGEGTSMDDIYNCISWLCEQGKTVSSGRNFSVVNDKWKGVESKRLAAELKSDQNMYKLRRYKNDFLVKGK